MHKLRFRHVHLDFHTSEKIPGVGSEFDADEFVATLEHARVNSINLFAKCHHGMLYYYSRFPAQHPHLTCNLLALQIEACHKHDIRCPIYISVGFDEYMAREHPEWVEVDEAGRRCGPAVLQPGWKKMCFASPYIDYVIEQTEEVLDIFGSEVDGFWFDIISQGGVFGKWALAEFDKAGLDPRNPDHVQAVRQSLVDRFRERMTVLVRTKAPQATIFYNSGHVYPGFRRTLHCFTHLELESLPSGGWGYAHFPVTVRYARGLGLDYLGMTGKFSKTWGHFNSYKPQAALEYECLNMLANGAKCCVGDQLHPRGRLDPATYELLRAVYEKVEEREPWCEDAEALAEIGVFNVEAIGRHDAQVDSAALGAYRALLEGRHQFDFVDAEMDWSRYRLIILPDKILCDEALARKVDDYVASGGSLIASHESGLTPDKSAFALKCLPVRLLGDLPYHPDFLKPLGDLADNLPRAEIVMYDRGLKVEAAPEAQILARIWEPYFNREWNHFCSHFHTPPEREGPDPDVVAHGRVVYFAHPIFGCFGRHGMVAYKYLILNAVRRLVPDPMVIADAPTTLHITVCRQEAKRRMVYHLIHYIPEKRTLEADYLEDILPLYDIPLWLRAPRPAKAYLAPRGGDLDFTVQGAYVHLRVPEIRGHAMVVLDDAPTEVAG